MIFAKPVGSTYGTLLCGADFASHKEARRAMTEDGIEIIRDGLSEAYAKRCLSAGKAELLI
jgi:hypothetical protein